MAAIPHRNKREKAASLLFDLVKYLVTVIGIGALVPESRITNATVLLGLTMAAIILGLALVVTPEDA
jgi:hypothetical protein